jgi:hypothetical protein
MDLQPAGPRPAFKLKKGTLPFPSDALDPCKCTIKYNSTKTRERLHENILHGLRTGGQPGWIKIVLLEKEQA